jgi:hypothetical protein
MPLISTFLPLLGFVVALGVLSTYLDSVARRVAPDLVSSGKSRAGISRAPQDSLTWLRLLGQAIALALALILWIRGSPLIRYALILLLSVSFAWISYKNRIRPLLARGVSIKERIILVALAVVAVVTLSYALLGFVTQR